MQHFCLESELNRNPTRDALRKKNIFLDTEVCALCEYGIEMAEHLLTACEFSYTIWMGISRWLNLAPVMCFSVRDILDLQKYTNLRKREAEVVRCIFITTCWCIWNARNEKVFKNVVDRVHYGRYKNSWFSLAKK
ncbi:putative reverse transcriptase zinc-binding domain-containing protein [Helianthus annuus]|nr:putative reverse transcriptase zinc-binding domain-containing protein [Helianthus annuus]